MPFYTDIVAINLREYSHSPQLLADLAREGYELFSPAEYVFFRRHNRLASTPDVPPAPAPPAEPSAPSQEG